MDKQAFTELLADPAMERMALGIIRENRLRRAAAMRDEVDYETACRIYGVSYDVMRSIKCLKRMRGARGFINATDLSTYMRGYKPWRPERIRRPSTLNPSTPCTTLSASQTTSKR